MKIFLPMLLWLVMISSACVNDNEKVMFPHIVIPDSAIQGQVAWFSFDSTLGDQLRNVDPLRFWGDIERGRDHNRTDSAALVMDGIQDYLSGFIGRYDSLAISLWFLPMPNYNKSYLFDYGVGQFSAGLDAITSATMPRFRMFMQQDTSKWYWTNQLDYFFWHHMYLEIGNTINPPRLYIDGYLPDTVSRPWRMHPLTDILYLARPYNADIMDTLLYRGYLDEIRIFNKFLTEEEILSLFWEGKMER
ncbi:MAG: hypothetical protein NTV01_22640 [Bacteroidia bacterium]|nr:hypothetical protein [Bacteroidia bacterium]